MNKSRLQEICHRKRWSPPEYSTTKEGPPHNPTFIATVTVGGHSFFSDHPARSAKEAQNNAAGLAIQHFTDPKPSPFPGSLSANADIKSIPATTGISQPEVQTTSQPHQAHEAFLVTRDDKKSAPAVSSSASNIVIDVPATKRALQLERQEACQTPEGMQHLYKTQLQNYAQKRNLPLPKYSCESTGPSHNPRFKSKVTIAGQTYESSEFFPTLKDAEHAAAKIALMSLSPDGDQEDDYGVYKNLLQEMARKEGYQLPLYSTEKYGSPHTPMFLSTVEIEGEAFVGQKSKTKKQAEMIAAKVAYTCLKERRSNLNHKSLSPSGEELKGRSNLNHKDLSPSDQVRGLEFSYFDSESRGIADLQQNILSKNTLVLKPSAAEQAEDRGESSQRPKTSSAHFPVVKAVKLPHSSSPSSGVADLSQNVRPQSNLILLNQSTIFAEQDEDREVQMDPATKSSKAPSSPQNGNSSPPPTPPYESCIDLVPPEGNEDSAFKKVIVFPNTLKISKPLPATVILRPIGDDWVAAEFNC